MNIVNDNKCSWLNDLNERTGIKTLDRDEINIIESRSKPTWLPPQTFLNIGVITRLMFERFRSRSDV